MTQRKSIYTVCESEDYHDDFEYCKVLGSFKTEAAARDLLKDLRYKLKEQGYTVEFVKRDVWRVLDEYEAVDRWIRVRKQTVVWK